MYKIFFLILLSCYSFSLELTTVENFSIYPISKENTSISRGGLLSDKEAATDGIGTIVLGSITSNTDEINNLAYNTLIKNNLSDLNDTVNLNNLTLDTQLVNEANYNKLVAGSLFDPTLHADGKPCDDGNDLTSGETWLNNICQGGIIPDGTSCDDGNPYSYNDQYINNICTGTGILKICISNYDTTNSTYITKCAKENEIITDNIFYTGMTAKKINIYIDDVQQPILFDHLYTLKNWNTGYISTQTKTFISSIYVNFTFFYNYIFYGGVNYSKYEYDTSKYRLYPTNDYNVCMKLSTSSNWSCSSGTKNPSTVSIYNGISIDFKIIK